MNFEKIRTPFYRISLNPKFACKRRRLFNIYDKIKNNPDYYRQLRCGETLITSFDALAEALEGRGGTRITR